MRWHDEPSTNPSQWRIRHAHRSPFPPRQAAADGQTPRGRRAANEQHSVTHRHDAGVPDDRDGQPSRMGRPEVAEEGADQMFGESVGLHAGPVALSVLVERREPLPDRDALIGVPLGQGGAQEIVGLVGAGRAPQGRDRHQTFPG